MTLMYEVAVLTIVVGCAEIETWVTVAVWTFVCVTLMYEVAVLTIVVGWTETETLVTVSVIKTVAVVVTLM